MPVISSGFLDRPNFCQTWPSPSQVLRTEAKASSFIPDLLTWCTPSSDKSVSQTGPLCSIHTADAKVSPAISCLDGCSHFHLVSILTSFKWVSSLYLEWSSKCNRITPWPSLKPSMLRFSPNFFTGLTRSLLPFGCTPYATSAWHSVFRPD